VGTVVKFRLGLQETDRCFVETVSVSKKMKESHDLNLEAVRTVRIVLIAQIARIVKIAPKNDSTPPLVAAVKVIVRFPLNLLLEDRCTVIVVWVRRIAQWHRLPLPLPPVPDLKFLRSNSRL
jgi:hypothetical protein